MERSILFLMFGWGWFVGLRVAGFVNIEQCRTGGFVDIVENAETNITCSGLSDTANVTWSMLREGSLLHDIATCTPSNCTLLLPGQLEVQRSPGQSLLVYQQEDRTADENARVTCTGEEFSGALSGTDCKFHVISPAVLSGCVVEEDRDNGTVNGSCHFERAYSARKNFTCMWNRTPTDPDQTRTTYTGVILNKEEYSINGQVYERGQCILSIPGQRWEEANYTYNIDFYPGSGPVPVPVRSQGDVNIEQCGTGGFVDIVENAETNITCSGLSDTANVRWSILRESSRSQDIATCTPSNCTLLLPGQLEVQRSPGQSLLVYQQEDRTADENARVTCTGEEFSGALSGTDCKFHVISPAVLSGCVVEEDRDNGTVNGSCHFERAYSARKNFTCMWYQTTTDPDQTRTTYTGVILNKEEYSINGQVYERGQCILSIPGQRWEEANYTYNIDFYPGSGPVPVPVRSQGDVNIEQCGTGGFVDIVENAETNITCSGLSDTANVRWSILRESSRSQDIATCTPSNCTLLLPGQLEVQRSPGQSLLVYQQEDRTADENARVTCTGEEFSGALSGTDCKFHVISPAVLSGCVVEEDRDNGTVNGSCHFERAYSARKNFTCMWYQTTTDPDQTRTTYTGVILNKEGYSINGQVYERGQCILSIPGQRWNEANSTYSIDFYPGSGPVPVPIGSQGDVNIEQCGTGGFVDIVENAETNITCSGLSDTANVRWSILRESSQSQDIATCTPSNCTLLLPGQFEVQRSPGQSLLVYRQENRTADENAKLTCQGVKPFGSFSAADCKFHVISPAVLSGCVVEEDIDNGTVSGSCHFERAYSASKDFSCMWNQTPTDPEQTRTTYPGIILNKEEYSIDGQVYERGQCILSIPGQRWNEANSTYSIDFYPGSGPVPVPIGSQGSFELSGSSGSSPRLIGSSGSSPRLIGSSGSSPRPIESPGSPGTPRSPGSSSGSWKAYVIGGVVAALVAAGVVLVVIAVVFKRKKSRGAGRHMASDEQPGPTRSTEQISQAPGDGYLTLIPYHSEGRGAGRHMASDEQPGPTRSTEQISQASDDGYLIPLPYHSEDRGAGQHMARSSEDRLEAVRQMNLVDSQGYSVVPAAALQGGRVKLHLTRADQPEGERQMNLEDYEGYSVVPIDMLQGGRFKLHLTSEDQPEAVQRMNLTDSSGYSVVPADMLLGGRVELHLTRQSPREPPRSTEQLGGRDSDGYEIPLGRRV